MTSPVDIIKDRLSIVDVISMYIQLTPAGKNYKAKSPFKQERTPSFYVSPDKGLYHCFSTGKGGDMFTFVQEMEGLDFKGALKVLADKAGVSLRDFNPKEQEEKDKLFAVMEAATAFFEEKLSSNSDVMTYIINRGVEEKTVREFRVGFAPAGWRNLYDALSKKFSDKELAAVGLIKMTERGAYDTFRSRIMFPICDSSGRVIAFSGRIFEDPKAQKDEEDGAPPAKYVNSPDTPLFNKKDVLFAIDKAKHYIRKYNFTTIVEGQFDVIMLHQAGFKNTVAVSGTALADSLVGRDHHVNNLGIVKRLSNNLVLAFDADSAGVAAAKRSASIALTLDMDVKVLDIAGGKDPADIIKDSGKDAWSKILRGAEHVILYYTNKIKEQSKDLREVGRRIKEEVLPEIVALSSDIEKSYFIKEVSARTSISETALRNDLASVKGTVRQNVEESSSGSTPSFDPGTIERSVWGMYIASEKDEAIRKEIVDLVGEGEFARMEERHRGAESEFIFGDTDYLSGKDETLRNFKKYVLQKKLLEVKEALRQAETNGDDKRAEELLLEQQKLEHERDTINNSRY